MLFLNISQISQKNTCVGSLNKVVCLQACNFINFAFFSVKFAKFFKKTYFEEYLRTTTSVVSFSWLYVHYLRHRFINHK